MFSKKVLLITGGTGSFGNAVLKRFLETSISEIRIFSRDEKKQEDMRISFSNPKLKFIIGDVRNYDSVYQAMRGVDYVFHAAALKQVPSCEFYPMEAVQTNIFGTENVLNSAIANEVSRVIVLSTDKAVYPINSMGISKAMAEKLMVAKSRSYGGGKTVFCATRYGNVMGSRGSVIPLFISQIKSGREMTITDPNMTRFLMSLIESVDLVLHTFLHGEQGDIFVQKAPAASLECLALATRAIFNVNAPMKIIGTRHGEKLYESLISREEMARAHESEKYYRIPADIRDLNYANYFTEGSEKISKIDDYTSHNARQLNAEEVRKLLLGLDFIQQELHD